VWLDLQRVVVRVGFVFRQSDVVEPQIRNQLVVRTGGTGLDGRQEAGVREIDLLKEVLMAVSGSSRKKPTVPSWPRATVEYPNCIDCSPAAGIGRNSCR
jgi:hypothetical protein